MRWGVRGAAHCCAHCRRDGYAIKAVAADPTISVQAQLGAGEAVALIMALHHQARLIILDDLAARRFARQRGLPVIGTLGVLLEARRSNLIPAVRPIVDHRACGPAWPLHR